VERLGQVRRFAEPAAELQHDHHVADGEEPRRQLDRGAGLRVHRHLRGVVPAQLSGSVARQDEGEAHPSRAPRRLAGRGPRNRLELQRRRNRDQPGGRQLRRQRHLRVLVHREGPRP
jgi:hypothetical protein